MVPEKEIVQLLFEKLCEQPSLPFPEERKTLNAPYEQGVYIIRKGSEVLHVGRTPRGRGGLHQRLSNHLHGSSSFTKQYLNGAGDKLRQGHTYQCLAIADSRQRALLEAYAIGMLCPAHLGLGE